jgi:hypothetical protein
MSINYTWQIISLGYKNPSPNLSNVVVASADWSLFAQDTANNTSAINMGMVNLPGAVTEDALILTQNTMIARVQTALGQNEVSSLESALANTLSSATIVNTDWSKINTTLPWYSAE